MKFKNYSFFIFFILLGSCTSNAPPPLKDGQVLDIIYSNDVEGELEPCGCQNNPIGGINRFSQYIQEQKQAGADPLLLDSGGLLFRNKKVPPILADIWRSQADTIISSYNYLGFVATGVAENDLAAGLDFFKKKVRQANFPFLSSNLSLEEINFKKSLIIEKNGMRIALIGVSASKSSFPIEIQNKIKTAHPHQSVLSEMEKVYKTSNIIIILSHLGLSEDIKLAKALSQAAKSPIPQKPILIFGGGTESLLENPINESGLLIFQAESRNTYIGHLKMKWISEKNKWWIEKTEMVALDASFDPKEKPKPYVKGMLKIHAQGAKKLKEINDQIEQDFSAISSSEVNVMQSSVNNCNSCHGAQTKSWLKTAHAHALLTHIRKGTWKNPVCLSCHTSGIGDPGEGASPLSIFRDSDGIPQNLEFKNWLKNWESKIKAVKPSVRENPLAYRKFTKALLSHTEELDMIYAGGVQCALCHRVSPNHPADIDEDEPSPGLQPTKALCIKCHTKYQDSTLWDKDKKLIEAEFKKKWNKIKH